MIEWVILKSKNNKFIQKKDRNSDLSEDNLIEVNNRNQAVMTPMTREQIYQWTVSGYTPEVVQGRIIHS